MPASARPSEAPTMLASASGVSTTRSEPNFSMRPLVVRRVLVARGVVGRVVKAHAVRGGLDEARPAALARLVDGRARRRVDRHHVVAVDLDAVKAVARSTQGKAARCGLHTP